MSLEKLIELLKVGNPSVIVRDHFVDNGFFEIDPCNLNEGGAEIVVSRFKEAQDALLKDTPVQSKEDELGPRYSCYNQDGLPSVDPKKVSWLFKRNKDREDSLNNWPASFQH